MDFIRPELIPDPTVRRLSLYLRQLELFSRDGRKTVSSKQLGQSLSLTDAQVRKDLAYFGTFGHPGVGYNIDELIRRIRRILGTDRSWNVILIGVGNLGRALLSYSGFRSKGMLLVHALDNDPQMVGQTVRGLVIEPVDKLSELVKADDVKLVILAVPPDQAQAVANDAIAAGVRGILNFSPVALSVPSYVAVQAVDLAVQLEQLTFQVSLNAMTRSGVRHP